MAKRPNKEDYVGKTYGRLIIKDLNFSKKETMAICKCECGNEKEIRLVDIKSGHSYSCGCFSNELTSLRFKTHGLSRTRVANIWYKMKERCYNPNQTKYDYYGGRGIIICDEWLNDFMSFYEWSMSNGYSNNLEIDRIDNDGDYEPSNCRWVTRSQNVLNQNIRTDNTSGTKGVSWDKARSKWSARITINKKIYCLGRFEDIKDAIKAREDAEQKYLYQKGGVLCMD